METRNLNNDSTYLTTFQSGGVESSLALKAIFAKLQASTPLEPGCISYQVYTTEDHPDLFHIIEKWESLKDFEGHLAVIKSGGYIEQALKYTTAPIESLKILEFN